jgi:nicotinamidase/pyrazinamidase
MKAVALIDLQNDFIDGSMGVGSDKFYKAWDNIINLIKREKPDLILATMDYHPENHCSFKAQGGEWPSHCVQKSGGVRLNWKVLEFLDSLSTTPLARGEDYPLMYLKGQKSDTEEYGVDLMNADRYVSYLAKSSISNIDEIHVVGLCTDFCVKNCALETARNHRDLPIYIHKSCSVAIDPTKELDLYEYKNIKVVD